MAWRRAIGAVKDHTSIGLAKVNNSSNSLSDLDVAIVKATRHEEYPAEEKYIREILSLTSYSRHFISACVNTICRRLNKTKNWVVALKTLMLIQRLLQEGDPAYEQETFFATRRGTRLLNLSDFRDTSRSNSWDYSECVKVHEIFSRVSKQFDELDTYYHWCKDVGIGRPSDYPEVERITTKKLELMDEFIRDKAANAHTKRIAAAAEAENDNNEKEEKEATQNDVVEEDLNQIKALPAPESVAAAAEEERKEEGTPKVEQKEADLLDLGNDAVSGADQANNLALVLFDGGIGTTTPPPPPPAWEAFSDLADWETALVQTSSYLPHQKAALGGGLDMMLLDGLYQQGEATAAASSRFTGSASSVAFGSAGNPPPPTQMLALPAPPSREEEGGVLVRSDPFATSLAVAPPAYVQMTEMEKKQRLLVEEQMMWDQYARAGMQGQIGLPSYQFQAHAQAHAQMRQHQNVGEYGYGYGQGYGYRYGNGR